MHPLLITFATKQEARASLDLLEASKVDEHSYEFEQGWIKISGIGCLAALACVLESPPASEVWNLGIAGALRPGLQPFTSYSISRVDKWLPREINEYEKKFASRSLPSHLIGGSGLRLYSSDYPIHQQQTSSGDLVDMEGYGIVEGAKRLKVPCRLWKTVSDQCTPKGPAEIRERLPGLSLCLAEQLLQALKQRGVTNFSTERSPHLPSISKVSV